MKERDLKAGSGNSAVDLRKIARSFVENALVLGSRSLDVESFNERWFSLVSQELGIPLEKICYSHHPVWWHLTLLPESPLRYVHGSIPGEKSRVCFRDGVKPNTELYDRLTGEIFEKYGAYICARLTSLGYPVNLQESS